MLEAMCPVPPDSTQTNTAYHSGATVPLCIPGAVASGKDVMTTYLTNISTLMVEGIVGDSNAGVEGFGS
ncbi:hypothetical protein PQX77_019968 [Marasmius sp. AFHP31]|nr:hypothetical protein PQX77_019968 [Marasmius sp. AFHP31]